MKIDYQKLDARVMELKDEHGENELRIRCVPAVDHQYFIVADNDGGIRLAYVHEDDTQKGFLGPCSVNR